MARPQADERDARQDRQRAPGRMEVARAPAEALGERDERVSRRGAEEREAEQPHADIAAADPPAGGGEQQKPGHRPVPQPDRLRQARAEGIVGRAGDRAAYPDVPVPEEVADAVDGIAVVRKEAVERVALDAAQHQGPAEADDQRQRRVPGREREQAAIAPGTPGKPGDPRQREQRMRHRVVQDQRHGADEAGEQQAPLQQQPDEDQVEQQMRGHREIGDRHRGEPGRGQRQQHRPAGGLRLAGQARGQAADEDKRERGEQRIARPRHLQEAERREQQGEPRPVGRGHLSGLERAVQEVMHDIRRNQPSHQLGRKMPGEVPRGERPALQQRRVFVRHQRMVVLDVKRAEAKHDEGEAGSAPGMPRHCVHQGERHAPPGREPGGERERRQQRRAGQVLGAQVVLEDPEAVERVLGPGVVADVEDGHAAGEDARHDQASRAEVGAHAASAGARSSSGR